MSTERISTLLLLLALAVFGGCDNTYDIADPIFTDITPTDSLGSLTGPADPDDWRHETDWTAVEQGLFPNYATYVVSQYGDQDVSIAAGYPNPTQGQFVFVCLEHDSAKLSFRVVNKDFTVLSSKDTISHPHSVLADFSVAGLTASELIRMYYILTRNDTIVQQGHGDIRLIE